MEPGYKDFDAATFGGDRTPDYRTPFQVDRDRIVHFPAFRRLQAKTQVFLPGEYDFYRTRLTHSLEVAQVGRSIAGFLRARDPLLADGSFRIDPDLIEAVCLAHDLGHPPFGHIGERELNRLLAPWGGFEGNAQTLRLLTEQSYERAEDDRGMKPTRALLDGVMKYKRTFRECPVNQRRNHFLYDEQAAVRSFVWNQRKPPPRWTDDSVRSIECQIMDWADDTAYSLHDIVDGWRAGFLSLALLKRWSAEHPVSAPERGALDSLTEAFVSGELEVSLAQRVGHFVRACSLRRRTGFLASASCRHQFELVIEESARTECNLYKRIAVDLIFKSQRIQEIEFKGRHILNRLFEAYAHATGMKNAASHGLAILPQPVSRRLSRAADERARMRVLADHLASMTDAGALRTYKRLFDPDFRSITEIV